MEVKSITELINHWKKCNVYVPPDEFGLLDYRLRNDNIIIPKDFKDLYKVSNGTSDRDDISFTFYGVGRLITMGSMFSLGENHPLRNVVVFVDYMDECWWYGVNVTEEGYEIGIISSGDKFKIIANSLAEFIHLYLSDADILSEYL